MKIKFNKTEKAKICLIFLTFIWNRTKFYNKLNYSNINLIIAKKLKQI